MFIGVSPSLGVSDLQGLIALAKQKPDEIAFAATGIGRLTHLTGELLQHEGGFKLNLIPYTGAPSQAMSDIATGRVSVMIEGYPGIAGAARAGSIKLIAVASAKRLPEFPDVPTVSETIPNFQATGWAVLVAPLGTPESIIQKINSDLRNVSAEPELLRRLAAIGTYPNPMRPDEVLAFVQQQQRVWQPVLDEIAKRHK